MSAFCTSMTKGISPCAQASSVHGHNGRDGKTTDIDDLLKSNLQFALATCSIQQGTESTDLRTDTLSALTNGHMKGSDILENGTCGKLVGSASVERDTKASNETPAANGGSGDSNRRAVLVRISTKGIGKAGRVKRRRHTGRRVSRTADHRQHG